MIDAIADAINRSTCRNVANSPAGSGTSANTGNVSAGSAHPGTVVVRGPEIAPSGNRGYGTGACGAVVVSMDRPYETQGAPPDRIVGSLWENTGAPAPQRQVPVLIHRQKG
ncbi:hypothetical protein [Egicoccus sp. AB-alg6-2]|uniref:hypothetical protein n=1 Tax=Egicoccus sp. AB-alg6-2 TaxID=3242692 RepID=UPI00359EAE10